MIERIFIGWERPVLPHAAQVIRVRCAPGGAWEECGVCVVVPGARAARQLARLFHDASKETGTDGALPEILTPAAFLDRCHTPGIRIATPTEARCAWMAAAEGLTEADRRRLAPTPGLHGDGPMAWVDIAVQAQELRDALAAECLTIADVAVQCPGWDGVLTDRRWDALARLERAYLDVLLTVGLLDRNDAFLTALASGGVTCEQVVCLVGAQDLNGLEQAMLRALSCPVCALIPAPDSEQDGFDDFGVLRAAAWLDRPIPIPDSRLHFVGGPAAEANKVCDLIAALDGRYAREEITVGVGDETDAEGLGRRLAVAGLPTFSPFGRPVGRTLPAAMLTVIRDYLRDPSAHPLASLVRHPDLERWVEARLTELQALPGNEADPPFLSQLDFFLSECLTERLPVTEGARPARPTALDQARATVCAGRDAVETLLAPLRGGPRRLSAWAGPIADIFRTVCGAEPVDEGTPEGRQFGRSLARLAAILAGMARIPTVLAFKVAGPDALAFVLAEAGAERLPSDDVGAGLEMMGWLELALDDAPVLLLTGLHEGCVPKNTGDDPLLPDSLRARLGLADDRRRQARDAFLLRVLLESRADIHLIVARRGADGSPKMPSRLLFACEAPVAAGRARRFARPDADAPARSLFAPGAGRHLVPLTPQPLSESLHTLRVTGFRDYLTCPYRFYLRHVLKLEAQDDPQDEMDARLFGILLHDCLDGFAHSDASDCADPDRVRDFLRGELRRQFGRRFGTDPSRILELQARQAGRRLDAFADWQAQSVRDGWRIEPDLAEQDLTALFVVDDQDFVITGRPDRVDYCPNRGFRIIDYKTGDSGKGPDERHRKGAEDSRRWADLQLPLYRRLLEAHGKPVAPAEMGYVLLSADLTPVTQDVRGRHTGGTGFVPVPWTEDEHVDALRCAEDVIRSLRAGVFWPPTDPPPFPPSRTGGGRTDPYGGLCQDSCPDRSDWLGLRGAGTTRTRP